MPAQSLENSEAEYSRNEGDEMKSPKKEQLFDVIIFHSKTLEIESIAGKNMRMDTGHYNAEGRLATVLDRINDDYEPGIVYAGKYAKGDNVNRNDLQ
jgi:hypothetical protein